MIVVATAAYFWLNEAEYHAALIVRQDGAMLTVTRNRWSASQVMLIARTTAPTAAGPPCGTFERRSSDRAAANDSPIVEVARDPTPPPMWRIRVGRHDIMITPNAVRIDGRHLPYDGYKPIEVDLNRAVP